MATIQISRFIGEMHSDFKALLVSDVIKIFNCNYLENEWRFLSVVFFNCHYFLSWTKYQKIIIFVSLPSRIKLHIFNFCQQLSVYPLTTQNQVYFPQDLMISLPQAKGNYSFPSRQPSVHSSTKRRKKLWTIKIS